MSHNNIKRFLSAALLLTFMAPSCLAITGSVDPSISRSSMSLSGVVNLTDNNELITLSLRDSDVKQVLRMFADKAGLNIVFHNSVSGQVTLDLVDTPINEAFNLVLQITGMNYYKQGSTMIVMSKDTPVNAEYSKQEMLVFPIKYVNATNIAQFLNKNVFGMKKAGLSGVDAATVNSATNELIVFGMPSDVPIIEKVIERFDKEPFTRTFAVNHTTPAEMANMICQVLLPSRGMVTGGSDSSGGGAGAESGAGDMGGMLGGAAEMGGGDSSGIKLGEGVLACSVSSSTSGSVAPFDVQNLSVAYFPQRGTITLMGGSEVQATMIENFIKANDIKQPQALLEISIVELSEEGSKEFQNQWQIVSKNWGFAWNGSSFSGGRPGGDQYVERTRYVWDANWENDGQPYYDAEAKEFVVPNMVAQTYRDIVPSTTYITWTMNYLIENRKARVLANPKILITNGQESLVDLTQDYVEKVTSEYLTSSSVQGSSMGTVQRNYSIKDDLGIKVTLTPFISPEGYVTLNIKPEYSTVAGQVRSSGNVAGSQELAATLLSRRDLDLKNVRIKDGETLILGGMIQENEQKTVSKIPFLGDLPLIGQVFRSTSSTKAKSELVVMITPKILNDGEGAIADSL